MYVSMDPYPAFYHVIVATLLNHRISLELMKMMKANGRLMCILLVFGGGSGLSE